MTNRTRALALCALIALVAGACSPLGPIPDRSRYYTLAAPQSAAPEASALQASALQARTTVTYGLGPVTLPAYLDRTQIVTRVSPTEVRYSQWDRWASPLEESVVSLLRDGIAADLGTDRIASYPWTGTDVDYQVEVALLRFETDETGDTRLAARWTVRDPRRRTEVVRRETTRAQMVAPKDRAASTAALSAMLADLGREITEAIRDLPAPPRPPRGAK